MGGTVEETQAVWQDWPRAAVSEHEEWAAVPLAERQAIQWMLADCKTELDAASLELVFKSSR